MSLRQLSSIAFGLVLLFAGASALAEAPPRARVDQSFSLDIDCVWALALPAVIDEFNGTQHDTLEVDSASLGDLTRWRKYLQPEWGISDRLGLLATLDWLVRSGQSEEYDRILDRLAEFPDVGPDNLEVLFPKDKASQAAARFILSGPRPAGHGFIRAYDLARCVQIVRWCYQAGIIDNREAWSLIKAVAPTVHTIWRSWEEFGKSYLAGRLFWLSMRKDGAQAMERSREAYRALLAPGGWWTRMPWNPDSDGAGFCQLLIGKMYCFGYGVAADPVVGRQWLDKAAAAGIEEARRVLAAIGDAAEPPTGQTATVAPETPPVEAATAQPAPRLPAGDWLGKIRTPAHLDDSYAFRANPQNPQEIAFDRAGLDPETAAALAVTVLGLVHELAEKPRTVDDIFRRCGPPERISVYKNGADEFLSWWYGSVGFFMGSGTNGAVQEIRLEGGIGDFNWLGLRLGDGFDRLGPTIGPVKSTVTGRNDWRDGVLYRDYGGQTGNGYFANAAKGVRVFLFNGKVTSIYLSVPQR